MSDGIDKIDRADAAYWWFADHHGGQWTPEYRKLCAVARVFNPGHSGHGPKSETAVELYRARCRKAGCHGAFGWPLVRSLTFPGERCLSCPECGSVNILLTCRWGRGGRMGDPGGQNIARCKNCHYESRENID